MSDSPLASPLPWDLVSTAYEAEVTPVFEGYARHALQLAAPANGTRLVDVACGPGTLAVLAAQAGHPVDAIDFAPRMIERLDARIAELGLDSITSRVGDGQQLPYEAGQFAAGFSMFGLLFFPDRARGFAELARVLVPGARAVVSSWQPLDEVPVMSGIFGALRELLAGVFGQSGMPATSESPLTTRDACRAEMGVAFDQVEVHPVSHVMRYASPDAMWESIARTLAPIVLLRTRLGVEKWKPLDDGLRAATHRAVGDGPPEFAMHAWLSVGTARG
ncbi:MAG: class I SAM-dependent methyltransferase [Deltaproteobacteria bacterium]|nr:class I SAM-dependent methyltransferase [Deltaproteobacteria bacterium]